MTKRFSIATDPLSANEVQALKAFLEGNAWWYWLPNYWLVKDTKDTLTVEKIRDEIHRINAKARSLILELTPITWSACTKPGSNGRPMEAWLRESWPD